jgi:hemerythrin
MPTGWQDSFSIDVLDIDIQHKLLFEKFHTFTTAYDMGKEPEEIFRLFWFVEAYIVSHFRDEERLMQQIGFPNFPNHREQHAAFSDQVGVLKERLRVEGPTQELLATIKTFIGGWLINHISSRDVEIGRFMKTLEDRQ